MNKVVGSLILLLLSFATAYSDQFDKVRCGSDIPKALMGQRASNERVVVIEDRHKALGLKDLGANEISGRLSAVWWRICGAEYVLLEDDHVRDVLPFPSHSRDAPAFTGTCQINGKNVRDVIIAVLNNKAGNDPLTASAAWKIDQQRAKFDKVATEGLLCPRSGISTADGGK